MIEYFLAIVAIFIVLAIISSQGKSTASSSSKKPSFAPIADQFKSVDEVADALQREGLESSNLIIGIDFTASNASQGRKTFNGNSLHYVDPSGDSKNPYQKAIEVVGRTLERFDDDKLIPAFGFGDVMTRDHSVFPFLPDPSFPRYCHGVEEVLHCYNRLMTTGQVTLSGPTNFAPLINKAIEIVQESGRCQYHILIIVADGQVTNEVETANAIVRASEYPISIVLIGVGDGPWDTMEEYDDQLPARKFDNFQFVNYHKCVQEAIRKNVDMDSYFALNALMEIPEQFKACKKLGLIGKPADKK